MSALDRLLAVLPPIYTAERDAVLVQVLNLFALESDALQEDIERMRRTHWVRFAYRLGDLERIAVLMGTERYPWETLPVFRERLLARVKALLNGALGPGEIRRFVYDYLRGVETALPGTMLVQGLSQQRSAEQAFAPDPRKPNARPLALVENPLVVRRSATLQALGGRVPYLFRWEEHNRGLDETVATFTISGRSGGRTTVPLLANLSTGDLLGFAGRLDLGQTLVIDTAGDPNAPRRLRATIDGADATDAMFSVSGFQLGVPFEPQDHDEQPLLPRMARGANQWVFLAVGLYDLRGLDHFFFAIAGDALREGVFDTTFFDAALFPSGPVAGLTMRWTEVEPASFLVQVPHHLVIEPPDSPAGPVAGQVTEALRTEILGLRAAGVRAEVRLVPFVETQWQQARVRYGWRLLPAEHGSAGQNDQVAFGARFGETVLGGARLE